MADIIPWGGQLDAETTRLLLLDLVRRVDAGEELGSRALQIRQVASCLRRSVADLRESLSGLASSGPDEARVRAVAEHMLALAERNLALAEALLRPR